MCLTGSNLKIRNWVFSIPKRLRIYFLFDRKLLAKLSICAWKVIKAYLKSSDPDDSTVPGTSIAVQTYGDSLNFNSHLHAIVSDGCFFKGGDFHMAPGFRREDLEEIFQYEVLKMLKKEGKITDAVIENMLSAIQVSMSTSVTGSFPMTRQVSAILPVTLSVPVFLRSAWSSFCPLGYIPTEDSHDGTAKVIYTPKDRKSRKTFKFFKLLLKPECDPFVHP